MTKAETAALLTLIAAFDRRTIGEPDVEAWHLILAELDPEDCMSAVRQHYTDSRDWLMPADVRRLAAAAARRREGQRRLAALEEQIAAENPGEIHDRPVSALTVGRVVPFDDAARVERRAMLRAAAHARRERVEQDTAAANERRERLEQARRELDGIRKPEGAA